MKVIEFNTPDGVYQLPLIKVAMHRADNYVSKQQQLELWEDEVAYVMEDYFEGIDWIINNSDYEDWENNSFKLNNEVKVTEDEFWTSSDDFEIKEILPFD